MEPLAHTHNQGGVPIEIVGVPMNLPESPHQNAAFNWPTDRLEVGTPVMMVTGSPWRVSRPPVVLSNARVQVVLRDPARKLSATFTVPADALSQNIWNTGQPLPSQEDAPPDGQVPSSTPAPVPPPTAPGQPIPPVSEVPGTTNRPGAVVVSPTTPAKGPKAK